MEQELKPSLTDQVLDHFLHNLVENHGFNFLTPDDLSKFQSLSDLTNQSLLDGLMKKGLEVDNESN